MKQSKTTKKNKRKYKFYSFLSWFICFSVAALLVIFALSARQPSEDGGLKLSDVIGPAIYSFIVANIPLIVLALLVKDKIKPVIWAANVIMSNIVFGGVAIYITFCIWFIDAYLITYLKVLYRDRFRINKEIDGRL